MNAKTPVHGEWWQEKSKKYPMVCIRISGDYFSFAYRLDGPIAVIATKQDICSFWERSPVLRANLN